jgi:hypothetical protein
VTSKVLLTGIDPRLRSRTITAVQEDLQAMPGVLGVGASDALPIGNRLPRGSFVIGGVLPSEGGERSIATFGCCCGLQERQTGAHIRVTS